jgi:hypothetical protein
MLTDFIAFKELKIFLPYQIKFLWQIQTDVFLFG